MGSSPRASASGLSPGLESAGPLGRMRQPVPRQFDRLVPAVGVTCKVVYSALEASTTRGMRGISRKPIP
jgi:hypothetical protein